MSGYPDIAQLVPHAGCMCLLERIVALDRHGICCSTSTHRAASNPLRHAGRLSALHLAEYGAQAMAAHGSVQDPAGSSVRRAGMLVSIRDLELRVERLDDIAEDLVITAHSRLAQAGGLIYDFEAVAGEKFLGGGRVQVLFVR